MKIVFTISKHPISRFISWGLGEPVSHTAFVFDDKFVIHSSLFGVELAWLNTFKKKSDILFDLDYDLPLEKEEEVWTSLIDHFDQNSYDFGAFAYFIWRGILKKFFKVPFPPTNKWGSSKEFLCTEVIDILPDWLVKRSVRDYGMTSPYQLYLELVKMRKSA